MLSMVICDKCGQDRSLCGHTGHKRTLPVIQDDIDHLTEEEFNRHFPVDRGHKCQGCHVVLYGTYDEKCSTCEYEDMLPILDKLSLS